MWIYEKKLEYPVRVAGPNPALAKIIVTQYGGPDGEASAGLRYLNQRYTMPLNIAKGTLTDIGTEELAHMEIIGTIFTKLMEGATKEQLQKAGMDAHYVEHAFNPFYIDTTGNPWTAAYIQAKGDPVADLHEDLAAEEKARATYEHLLQLTDDPGVRDTLQFLREREVVHFQRFGETLRAVQEWKDSKKIF